MISRGGKGLAVGGEIGKAKGEGGKVASAGLGMMRMMLGALLMAAGASASPVGHAGQVVSHMQELNLEQVRPSLLGSPKPPFRPPFPPTDRQAAQSRLVLRSSRRSTPCWMTTAPAP